MSINDLQIKIFADGANVNEMLHFADNPLIKGFTTNPSLMRKTGITDYESFGRQILSKLSNYPISLEVFADNLEEMLEQAKYIASWGRNVNVKIPVTNTQGIFTGPIIEKISSAGISLNITAVMTVEQVQQITQFLDKKTSAIISVFAGRIADTGVDPVPTMQAALDVISPYKNIELLWASPREILNIFQAYQIGCHIITVAHDMLGKLSLVGKNLMDFSKETVQMFFSDAVAAGYQINIPMSV